MCDTYRVISHGPDSFQAEGATQPSKHQGIWQSFSCLGELAVVGKFPRCSTMDDGWYGRRGDRFFMLCVCVGFKKFGVKRVEIVHSTRRIRRENKKMLMKYLKRDRDFEAP